MRSPQDMQIVLIDITNACTERCSNWKRKPEDFGDQKRWCEYCGFPLNTFMRKSSDGIDGVPIYETGNSSALDHDIPVFIATVPRYHNEIISALDGAGYKDVFAIGMQDA